MALAMPNEVDTKIGPKALGKIWRSITRISLAPRAMAAKTNSRCRNDKDSARTRRVTDIHEVKAITAIRFNKLGSKKAIKPSSRKKVGTDSMTSVRRMISVSKNL